VSLATDVPSYDWHYSFAWWWENCYGWKY
jgi:hypothetical protein